MFRVQLFVKVNDARQESLLGSWTFPNEENAKIYAEKKKKQFRDSDYTVRIIEVK